MEIRIVEECVNISTLAQYEAVPIAFEVTSRFVVHPVKNGIGGLLLVEELIDAPYTKDYDAIDGENPAHWNDHFNLSRWAIFAAFEGEQRVGGAALACNTPDVEMLEGRSDLAVLWDLRVHPDYRGCGVGQRLFVAAEEWARAQGCRELKIETQNINVPACRFYARQGCILKTIRHNAYPVLLDEVQLLWYKGL